MNSRIPLILWIVLVISSPVISFSPFTHRSISSQIKRLSFHSKVNNLFVKSHDATVPISTPQFQFKDSKEESKSVAQLPTELLPGQVVEFRYKTSHLQFGRVDSIIPEKTMVKVTEFGQGKKLSISASSIISVWDDSDSSAFRSSYSPEEWHNVVHKAHSLINNAYPRKRELRHFWGCIQQRSKHVPVDSIDLAIYLYQEGKFALWLNPCTEDEDIQSIRSPSASERVAAAMLLFDDSIHFRPKQSTVDKTDETGSSTLQIYEGGYIVKDSSSVTDAECEEFISYYRQLTNPHKQKVINDIHKTNTTAEQTNLLQISKKTYFMQQFEAVEFFSKSNENLPPPKTVKYILKKLNISTTPSGAKEVIAAMTHASSLAYVQEHLNINLTDISTFQKHGDVPIPIPSSPRALDAADRLTEFKNSITDQYIDNVVKNTKSKSQIGKLLKSLRSDASTTIENSSLLSPLCVDLRELSMEHRPVCIDARRVSFRDDAISINPSTSEILIHVVDVVEYLRDYPELMEDARNHVQSIFLPNGPIHMMPATALQALSLSSQASNIVISVAVTVDFETGKIKSSRLFPAIIGPVTAVDSSKLDLAFKGTDECDVQRIVESTGYPESVIKDLNKLDELFRKIMKANPWIVEDNDGITRKITRFDRLLGTHTTDIEALNSHQIITNAMLSLYSKAVMTYCETENVPLPLITKFNQEAAKQRVATQPLRNWLSQMQQLQVRAAMRLGTSMSVTECRKCASYFKERNNKARTYRQKAVEHNTYESLYRLYSSAIKKGKKYFVHTVGRGIGGKAEVKNFPGIEAIFSHNLDKGEEIYAEVMKISPDKTRIFVQDAKRSPDK